MVNYYSELLLVYPGNSQVSDNPLELRNAMAPVQLYVEQQKTSAYDSNPNQPYTIDFPPKDADGDFNVSPKPGASKTCLHGALTVHYFYVFRIVERDNGQLCFRVL